MGDGPDGTPFRPVQRGPPAQKIQADMLQQSAHLVAGQHGGQFLVILGADLREHRPVIMADRPIDGSDYALNGGNLE